MKVDPSLPEPLLPYRLDPRRMAKEGQVLSEEYEIPLEDKETVLQEMYPFEDNPKLEDQRFDLHCERLFLVRDFKVVREEGINYLVSPYYYEGGGTVIDWMPSDWAEDA